MWNMESKDEQEGGDRVVVEHFYENDLELDDWNLREILEIITTKFFFQPVFTFSKQKQKSHKAMY